MRLQKKRAAVFCVILITGAVLMYNWTASESTVLDVQQRLDSMEKLVERSFQHLENSYSSVPYSLKEHRARNGCVCEGDPQGIKVPLADVLFSRVSAEELKFAFRPSELEEVKKRRQHEFNNLRKRTQSAADLLIVAKPNSPLQYPTQGVSVRPKKAVLIPGLALKQKSKSLYSVNLTAIMGTFDVSGVVNSVRVRGEGSSHIEISSRALPALNRQLQFITYTNTIFHPNTADVVPVKSLDTPSCSVFFFFFFIFSTLNRIKNLLNQIRWFLSDGAVNLQSLRLVTLILFLTLCFSQGWFAGRNLAISQVTTKYVLWVDDDFIFTSNTKLEKMVEVLEIACSSSYTILKYKCYYLHNNGKMILIK
uniref:Beta-1,4-N-acetyl-galactosaminyl transferase 1a n=1 Tax=Astyanax mexicanus TaxID=7994 RepID=A0A8B9H4R0_ASTMX